MSGPRAAAFLLALLAAPAGAQQAPSLARGWSLFHSGQLEAAQRAGQEALAAALRDEERRDANLLLGAVAWQRGDAWAAEERVIDALSFDPGYQPDPLHLSPELQQLVRRVARDRGAEIARRSRSRRVPRSQPTSQASSRATSAPAPAPRTPPPPPRARPRETPAYLAPLPFGVGQFLNGQRRKGWALLVGETALVATAIGCVSGALALRDRRGRYPEDVIGTARALNGIYLGSAYSALALMIYGAIDGLVYRRGRDPAAAWRLVPDPARGGLRLARWF